MLRVLDRRRSKSTPDRDDTHVELRTLSLSGFARLAGLSALCLSAGTVFAASVFHDRFLWRVSPVVAIISVMRVVLIRILNRTREERHWAEWGYAATTLLFCGCMAMLTMYSFRVHDPGLKMVTVIGTFTITAGLSSRVSFLPLLSEACIGTMLGTLAVALMLSPNPLLPFSIILVLVAAVTHCVFVANNYRIIKDQILTRRKLRMVAQRDWLTGLSNRHHFEVKLEEMCRIGGPFTVWMIDLDGFKNVNDTYGHAAGDELLKEVAQRLVNIVRHGDLVARQGGDEFVILQPDLFSEAGARELADRLQQAIAEPYQVGGKHVVIGASGGIKIVQQSDRVPDRVMQAADRALYRVKDSGQSGFAFA